MKDIEQEFKWNGSSTRAFERFLMALKEAADCISAPKKIQITDYYLDDEKCTLSAQKIALRIRHSDAKWEVTCKNRSRLKNGLAVRQERTWPLLQTKTIKSALKELAYCSAGKKLAAGTSLQVRFKICNHRQVYQVSYKNCLCEAALDDYLTVACGHQMKRKEIELELKKGRVADFKKLIENITANSGLQPNKVSKVAGAEKWILQKISLN